jgi:hypothetical protein
MKISQMIGSIAIATSIVTVAAIVSPSTANAATFTFNNISGASTVGDGLNGFLSMDVNDLGVGNGVLFQFRNSSLNTSTGSFIRTIFLDTRVGGEDLVNARGRVVNSLPAITGGDITKVIVGNTVNPTIATPYSTSLNGINFSKDLSGTLPQGNNLNPDFTTDLELNRITPGNDGAVKVGETLAVIFADANFSSIIASIGNGDLRVGYHLQGLNPGSDSYINSKTPNPTTKPVPVPGFLLGVMAAGALGGTRLLKNKKQAV